MRRAWLPVVAALVCACSGPPTPDPNATLSPGLPSPDPRASPTLVAGASEAVVPIDVSLLRYLPAAVGDFPVTYSPEATQDVARDRTLASTAAGVAYGMAADPVSGDVVVAAVVKLRGNAFSDGFFRDWRDSYDQATCAPAGGVSGHAEAPIDGRTVYIGTCGAGARTYHAFLEAAAVVISATSVGGDRFGEQLIGSLRP